MESTIAWSSVRRASGAPEVPPDRQQRLLNRILGEIGIAQDPVRDRVESVADGNGEAREGLLVTTLRASDQLGTHVFRHESPGGPECFIPYGRGVWPVGTNVVLDG